MSKYNFEVDLKNRNSIALIIGSIIPNSTVLEFGCAHGRLTKYLKEKMNCRVTIVEIDEEAGIEAKGYAEKAFLGNSKGDIEQYYWAEHLNEKFDYIVFADVLEHLYNPKEVLMRSQSFLNDNGEIIVSIPNIAHNSVIIDLLKGDFKYRRLGILDDTHIRFFTKKSFERMINQIETLTVTKELATYSEVGQNEIENSYEEVNRYLMRGLKENLLGNVYQYIFVMSKNKFNMRNEKNIDIEEYKLYELTLFWKTEVEDFNEKNSIKYQYTPSRLKGKITLPKGIRITQLRLDPFESNGLIKVIDISGIDANGNKKGLNIVANNAQLIGANYYFFEQKDPWFIIEGIDPSIDDIYFEIELLDSEMTENMIKAVQNLIKYKFTLTNNHINNLENHINDIEVVNKQLEEKLDLKENHISNIETFNKQLEEELVLKENHISNIETFNKQLEEELGLKENHINNIEAINKQLEAQLDLKENYIKNLEDLKCIQEKAIEQIQYEVEQLDKDNKTFNEQIYELTKQIQTQQEELNHIYASKIYKLMNRKIGRENK